jgi:hypothetical protein
MDEIDRAFTIQKPVLGIKPDLRVMRRIELCKSIRHIAKKFLISKNCHKMSGRQKSSSPPTTPNRMMAITGSGIMGPLHAAARGDVHDTAACVPRPTEHCRSSDDLAPA